MKKDVKNEHLNLPKKCTSLIQKYSYLLNVNTKLTLS